jgi:hypothetical protein
VAVDDHRNGWRHLVLPIAHNHDILLNSVLAATGFHLESCTDIQLIDPKRAYLKAIDGLRKSQDLTAFDLQEKQYVVLSLLVLLAATMVNASGDFRLILGLLEAAWQAAGGEAELAQGELGLFLVRQYMKCVCPAAP